MFVISYIINNFLHTFVVQHKPLWRKYIQLVDVVLRKGIEPAYNFQGIEIGGVKKEFALMSALLFYVVYTLWYGFAIFDLFEGIGLTMKKGKKQEA